MPPPPPDVAITGLIIDARGMDLRTGMTPRILKADGEVLLDMHRIDIDRMMDIGMVGYATTMEEARGDSRVGPLPCVLRAADRGTEKIDVVLTDEAFDRIKNREELENILYKGKVTILLDKDSTAGKELGK